MSSMLEVRVQNLEARLDSLMRSFIQSQANQTPITWKTDETASNVEALTPYTETKTAYIGDTQTVFDTDKHGHLTVYVEDTDGNCPEYTVERMSDRIIVKFEALERVASITISIL